MKQSERKLDHQPQKWATPKNGKRAEDPQRSDQIGRGEGRRGGDERERERER